MRGTIAVLGSCLLWLAQPIRADVTPPLKTLAECIVIAVDQHSSGNRPVITTEQTVIWTARPERKTGYYLAAFNRSDNESFADHGIPAHTVVVAFEFPDYHAVGDTWTKIDYANLAKVDRMLALGILMLADSPQAPKWNRRGDQLP